MVGVAILGLLAGVPGPVFAATGQASISCVLGSDRPVVTFADTPVRGTVRCTHSDGRPVSLEVLDEVAGSVALDAATGGFVYTPADGRPAVQQTGAGDGGFTVVARAGDGASSSLRVPIGIEPAPASCDQGLAPATGAVFNDPAGSGADKYRIARQLVAMIDCTPPVNPDGTQASIRFTASALSYVPVQAALSSAAQRGVSVHALIDGRSAGHPTWRALVEDLGSDTRAASFATTCADGCLTPRVAPAPGAPTAWFSAQVEGPASTTVVFDDHSLPGVQPIVAWRYEFGDGTSAVGPGPHTKAYARPGTYRASLTVTDAAGTRHTTVVDRTVPQDAGPPSMRSNVFLFSTVGTGSQQRRWVSGYSSASPVNDQARLGYGNLNLVVGDKNLHDILSRYVTDLVNGSRGHLLSPDYFRTFAAPADPVSGSPETTVHLLPQASGDIVRDILRSIRCRYEIDGTPRRTAVRISMSDFSRTGVAADLWRLAMLDGCRVQIGYAHMSQGLLGEDGASTEEPGVAECLSARPTEAAAQRWQRARAAGRDPFGGSGRCGRARSRDPVEVTSAGTWLSRRSPYGGGSLDVRMACPATVERDPTTGGWALGCSRTDLLPREQVMLVNGFVNGRAQKYVMTGSAAWTDEDLRSRDAMVIELQDAAVVHAQYRAHLDHQEAAAEASGGRGAAMIPVPDGPLDVRGSEPELGKG